MERLPDDLTQEGVLLPRKVLSADENSLIDRIQVGSGLSVSGISTFKNDVRIEGDLTVTDDIFFDEFQARQFVVTGVGTINNALSIGGTLGVPEAYISSGIITDIQVSGASTVTGIATFQSDVFIDGNLNVRGDIVYDEVRGRNLNISGVGTIANFNSGLGTITTLDTETFDALAANITGLAVTDIVGTAASITTIDVNEGDILNAKITAGIITSLVGTYATVGTVDIETLDARTVNITGLAVTDIVGTAASITTIDVANLDALNANITGLAVTDIVGTAATITTIDANTADLVAANINVGMITSAYITAGIVTDIQVSGASTVTGIATFQSDVFIAGNLNVIGDIVYDEVTGRNLNISGVGTIANLISGLGTITTLDTEIFDALSANITGLAVTDIVGTSATITTIDNNLGTIDNVATLDALNARITAGIITDIVGTAATITTLDVNDGDIVNARITAGIITDIVGTAATITTIDVDTLDALNARITAGIITDIVGTAATITTLDVNTGDIQTLFVNAGLATDLAVTNLRAQTGIITDAFINSGVITSITGTYSTITNLVGTSGTFQNLNVDVNLDVDGHTELDNVNISGISTLNNVEINGNLNIYTPDVLIQNNLLVSGNLSVGGTFTSVNVADLRVNDKDLVLGITTNLNNDDVSNDNTANHGGVAIASTEGSPLVSLKSTGINTLPDTYKQIMWVKGGTFGIGTTDAFLINYAVGIGSTNVPLDAYAAIGANHIYERSINTPNLNVAENAVVSGILTGTTFDSETAIIDNLQVAGTTTTGQLNVTGVSTFQGNVNLGDNDRLRFGDDNDLEIFHDGTNSNIQDNGTGSLLLYGNSSIELLSSGTGESLAKFFSDGAAELYYNNSKKFETATSGVNIVGTTTTGQLSVTGVSTFVGDITATGSIDVDGQTEVDNLNVSGIATVTSLDVQSNFDVYDTQATFHNDLYIAGNLSIGGTTTVIQAQDLKVFDKDIILGVTTDSNNNDVSNDTTANHGGIAIASTEGSPLTELFIVGLETSPVTYKKFMWFREGSFSGLGTDAWLSNYAVGVGSTQVPNGVRLAAGAVQLTDNTIRIDGVEILSSTTLGTGITASSLRSVAPEVISDRVELTTGQPSPSDYILIYDTDAGDLKKSTISNAALQGVQGIQGIQGVQGTQGTQGVQGTQGIQGVQGTQGIQGVQGTQGTQGVQGTQGIQGVQGTQGTQGVQGTYGTQGTQGIQGILGNIFWEESVAGISTTSNVGVNTVTLNDGDLIGIGNSFHGLYISNGMIVHDNVLSGNHYIGTAFNGLMAGPVDVQGVLTVDGAWVVV